MMRKAPLPLRRRRNHRRHRPPHPQTAQPQPTTSLAPGVVRVRGCAVVLAYRLAVVDVQPKPASKARAHAELDERIAAMPPLPAPITR